MRRILLSAAIIIAAAIAVSCTKGEIKCNSFDRDIVKPLPEGAPECALQDSLRIHYSLQLPTGEKWAEARESIIRSVIDEKSYGGDDTLSIDAHINSLIDNYYKEYNETMAGYDEKEMHFPPFAYNYDFTGGFLEPYQEKNVVTYKVGGNAYTGGAHGMYWETYFTFNMEDGKRVAVSFFVPEEKIDALRDLLYGKLSDTEGFFPDFVTEETELATENFFVNQDGMTFVYNPYEVGPYSSGIIMANVAWSEIEAL